MNGLRFAPQLESLDNRLMPSASPLPVLMVIADQQDFFVSEKPVAEAHPGGVNVALADGSVRFLNDSYYGTGVYKSVDSGKTWPAVAHDDIWVDGKIITAENPKSADYSAIAFVGGWGSSMYQYAS